MSKFRLFDGLIVPLKETLYYVRRRQQHIGAVIKALPSFFDGRGVCVQAGGNWGLWPLHFADLFKTVYTFEPDPDCFVALANNTRHKPNIVRLQAALGYANQLVGLSETGEGTTGNAHVEPGGIFPTFAIDELSLPECDLIYLDVEGSELRALYGATVTLIRCKPIVAFEVSKKYDEQGRTEKYMSKYGYKKIGRIGRDVIMAPC